MKNILIEGLQGAGKSTLVNALAPRLPQLHVYREGDYSPVDLAWCAWMTGDEYAAVMERFADLKEEIARNTVREGDRFVVTYTKIRTDNHDVFKTFEAYEIYNGRKSLAQLQEIVLARYAAYQETGGLFECAFFQNVIVDLILYHQLSDDDIVAFYSSLWDVMDKDNFGLLYLYSDQIEENILAIKKERCDGQGNEIWYEMMLDFLTKCPYGQAHGYSTFEDMAAHFRHRQRLELRIIREVLGECAVVLEAKNWEMDEVLSRL